jgi:hypothetical protein
MRKSDRRSAQEQSREVQGRLPPLADSCGHRCRRRSSRAGCKARDRSPCAPGWMDGRFPIGVVVPFGGCYAFGCCLRERCLAHLTFAGFQSGRSDDLVWAGRRLIVPCRGLVRLYRGALADRRTWRLDSWCRVALDSFCFTTGSPRSTRILCPQAATKFSTRPRSVRGWPLTAVGVTPFGLRTLCPHVTRKVRQLRSTIPRTDFRGAFPNRHLI